MRATSLLIRKLFMILIIDYREQESLVHYKKNEWVLILETSHLLMQKNENPIIALYAALYIVSGLICQDPKEKVFTLKDLQRISDFAGRTRGKFSKHRLGWEFCDFILTFDEIQELNYRHLLVIGFESCPVPVQRIFAPSRRPRKKPAAQIACCIPARVSEAAGSHARAGSRSARVRGRRRRSGEPDDDAARPARRHARPLGVQGRRLRLLQQTGARPAPARADGEKNKAVARPPRNLRRVVSRAGGSEDRARGNARRLGRARDRQAVRGVRT